MQTIKTAVSLIILVAISFHVHAQADTDGDGFVDTLDNCPNDFNHYQSDSNQNGVGNVCDSLLFQQTLYANDIEANHGLLNSISSNVNITTAILVIGDRLQNQSLRGFISFVMDTVSPVAGIQSASLLLSNVTQVIDAAVITGPIQASQLGPLMLDVQLGAFNGLGSGYTLAPDDFSYVDASTTVDAGSFSYDDVNATATLDFSISDKAKLALAASTPSERIQLRLYHPVATDNDGAGDLIRFSSSIISNAQLRPALLLEYAPSDEFDQDQDGAIDGVEQQVGSDMTLVDTDGDGLSDGFEINFDGDPSYNPLTDLNPLLQDTDGDGFNDSAEVNFVGSDNVYILGIDLNPLLVNDLDKDGDGTAELAEQEPNPINPTDFTQVADYIALCAETASAGDIRYVNDPLIAGVFVYNDTDPVGNGGDAGINIQCSASSYWHRQYAYSEYHPIELDWFGLANGDDVTPLLENLGTLTNKSLYAKLPSTLSELKASNTTFFDYEVFHLLENIQPILISLYQPRYFVADGEYNASDPLDLDIAADENCLASVWNFEGNYQWSIDLADLGFLPTEIVQSVWSNDPRELGEGKVFHWGGDTRDAIWDGVEAVDLSKAAGFMRWYSDSTKLYIAASDDCEITPFEYFETFEVTPDNLIQMWHFYNPREVYIGGNSKNLSFEGAFRMDRQPLGGWNGVQTYSFVGGIARRGPTFDSYGGNYALLGLRPARSAAEPDTAVLLANFYACFNYCVNVTGGTSDSEDQAFGQFTIGGDITQGGLRFNSGIVHLHVDDVFISDPFRSGVRSGGDVGWSGSSDSDSNWDQRLYGREAGGLESTYVVQMTGNVTTQYSGSVGFNTRNGRYTKASALNWTPIGGDVYQAAVSDVVSEIWGNGDRVGDAAETLANEGDWRWQNGLFEIKAATLDLTSITLLHERFMVRYKDHGWAIDQSGQPEQTDLTHQGYKVDYTGYANPDESFLLFEVLPADLGKFAVKGLNILRLEATNEGTGAVFNLSEQSWVDLGNNLWRTTMTAGLTGSEAVNHLLGDGLSLKKPLATLGELSEQGSWIQSVSGGMIDVTLYSVGPPTCAPLEINCTAVYEQLIGGSPYVNEFHNIVIKGFDAVDSTAVNANVISALLESGGGQSTNNGQDYSQNHTFTGIDQSISMHKGALTLHEYNKVSDWIGHDILLGNQGYAPNGDPLFWANIPVVANEPPPNAHNFSRWSRGNRLKNIVMNGTLDVHGGSRDNIFESVLFNGLPRQVVVIKNNVTDPVTQLAFNNISAAEGSWIDAAVRENVELMVDGIVEPLPYQFGQSTQFAGTAETLKPDSWALYKFNQNNVNEVASNPFVLIHDFTNYTEINEPLLNGFDHGIENGGIRGKNVSMDTFNQGINLSFWAAFDSTQLSYWTNVVSLFATQQNNIQIRLFDPDYTAPYEFKDFVVTVSMSNVSHSAWLINAATVTNILDGKVHYFQVAFDPSGDRRVRIAIDGVIRQSELIPGTAQWQNNNDVIAPDIVRNNMGIGCSWANCNNLLQGIIDEVHIRQCVSGDADCSELASVTRFEDIEDRDADSMTDKWERDNQLDPTVASDAVNDPDLDGLTNLQEFQAGTLPNNNDTDDDGLLDGDDPEPLIAIPQENIPIPFVTLLMVGLLLSAIVGTRSQK